MKQFEQSDIQNIEVIFSYARQAVINNEKELISLIQYKQVLIDKINGAIPKAEVVKTDL